MRLKITLLLLLFGFAANAKFVEATITFIDGHVEKGLVKSFLEAKGESMFGRDFIDDLNLTDKTLKFKLTEDSEVQSLKIEDIKEIQILKGDVLMTFTAMPLKTINKKGEIVDYKKRVWLPCYKKGKINMYAVAYWDSSAVNLHYLFYFQRPGEEFALSPYQNTTVFGKKNNATIILAFYKYLFESCPDFYTANTEAFRKEAYNDFPREEKYEKSKAAFKIYQDESIPVTERNFKYQFYGDSLFIDAFEKECK